MEEKSKHEYVRRSQRDYTLTFKLQVAQEIESGALSIYSARKKHEFLLEDHDIKLPVMKELVKESIETYNTRRPHHSCYMKTPEQMHKQAQIKIRTYKKANRTRANLDAVR